MRSITYKRPGAGHLSLQAMRATAILFLCLLLHLGALAQHLTLIDSSKPYPVEYPLYLEDREGSFHMAEVIDKKDSFTRSTLRVPDFLGNFSKVIWYKFTVQNQSQSSHWFLEVKGGYMHELTLYRLGTTGYDSLTLMADKEVAVRPVLSNNLVFPVSMTPGGETTFYLRATSKTLIRASMSFSTMQHLYEKSIYSSYLNGFLAALAVALLLYNLFVYFSLREKVYLYYIGYIFSTILHTNLVAGNLALFLPWLDWLNTTLLLPVLAFFSILFTNSFLQTRKYVSGIYRIRWILTSLCIIPILFFFAGEYAVAILLVSIFMFLLFVYWLTAGILAYRNGFQPAIFYIIGFGSLITMNLVFELKILGWVRESYWIDSALSIGAAIEAIVLSFALASKINFYKKEKELIQEHAYQQAVNFSRELINMQEAERKRIAAELHDSVGQKLILIKNKVLRFTKAGSSGFQQNPEALAETVADAIQEIRSISYALRPYQIDLLGLTQSIKSLVSESMDTAGIQYKMEIDNIDTIRDPEIQINIYRIIQECINNICKHAQAQNTSVSVHKRDNTLDIRISDDGVGFDPDQVKTGFGLRGIQERLHILSGTIETIPGARGGSSHRIIIPINVDE